ncbi:MAG: DinB family protein [Candidatus Cloacimonetes bacterium]|nr:DinB family protein [Candidatus Cloacimonadota bacterium]
MASVQRVGLDRLASQCKAIGQEVEQAFATMGLRALNTQPGPGRWSVAQCLDHLVVTDRGYLELGHRLARGETVHGFMGRLPLLPALFGGMLLASLTPTPARKYKAPASWQPSADELPVEIVPRFLEQQHHVLNMIHAAGRLDAERIIVSSPAAHWMCYSWADALRILVAHQRRHLNQALAVKAGLPGST